MMCKVRHITTIGDAHLDETERMFVDNWVAEIKVMFAFAWNSA
jgi:hypothetical protein